MIGNFHSLVRDPSLLETVRSPVDRLIRSHVREVFVYEGPWGKPLFGFCFRAQRAHAGIVKEDRCASVVFGQLFHTQVSGFNYVPGETYEDFENTLWSLFDAYVSRKQTEYTNLGRTLVFGKPGQFIWTNPQGTLNRYDYVLPAAFLEER